MWREPDSDPEVALDRDARATRYAASKAAGREKLAPRMPGGEHGGGLRRMIVANVSPTPMCERPVLVPGRYVPVGFARYVSPLADPLDYEYYRLSGWRVAVPRAMPGERVRDLLYRIYHWGPSSAGYVRLGDALVPAILSPGDRMTVSQAAPASA